MALLTPNSTFQLNGVTVREKIIPDNTRWKDGNKAKAAGFSAGSLYKKQQKIGRVQSVTIHNTEDLPNVLDDGEQYTRATYNENMGSVRVHFYVDETGAWQNLRAGTGLCANDPAGSAEVGWHAGDGSVTDGGNMTSISLEVIMNDNDANDAKARDNAARMAAWLLHKHGLDVSGLVSHTYWVNKSAGKRFSDVDEQCTNLVAGKKWCPAYIFGSTNHAAALKNWKAFKATVQKYLEALNGASKPAGAVSSGKLYCVQTGAFSSKTNADAYAAQVKAAGFEIYTVQADGLYKVQVGAFGKKENADALKKQLEKAGFQAFVTEKSGVAV